MCVGLLGGQSQRRSTHAIQRLQSEMGQQSIKAPRLGRSCPKEPGVTMSRRSNLNKRRRQKQRASQRPQLPPTNNVSTGEPQQTLQTPTHSYIRRISSSALIKEIQRRPESRGLIAAIAESQRS